MLVQRIALVVASLKAHANGMLVNRLLAAFALLISFAAPAYAQRDAAFRAEFGAFVDALRNDPNAPPGFAVVVTRGDRVLFEGAYGVRDAARGAPMTLDTPLITASITKSYTALLATRLDERGVLSLDASLADVWPDLVLSEGLDARAVTVRRLLSHQAGVSDFWLDLRSITAGNVTLADVAPHLSRHAAATEPGFQYSNFGPFLYSMMVEQVTGRDWRAVLEDEVLRPMRLRRTSIRVSDLPQDEVGHCHTRRNGGWVTLPLDPPQTLNAAAGLHASVRDASRFVRAFAQAGRGIRGMSPESFSRTMQHQVAADGDLGGLMRDGYALGWDLSSYEGERIVSRSGGYPGCRTIIAFSQATGMTVTAFAAGDWGANPLIYALVKQAFDIGADRPERGRRTAARLDEVRQAMASGVARADAVTYPALTGSNADEALARFTGIYEADVTGAVEIRREPRGLVAMWGAFRMDLTPNGADMFNGYVMGLPDPWPITFISEHGHIVVLEFGGERLARVR